MHGLAARVSANFAQMPLAHTTGTRTCAQNYWRGKVEPGHVEVEHLPVPIHANTTPPVRWRLVSGLGRGKYVAVAWLQAGPRNALSVEVDVRQWAHGYGVAQMRDLARG